MDYKSLKNGDKIRLLQNLNFYDKKGFLSGGYGGVEIDGISIDSLNYEEERLDMWNKLNEAGFIINDKFIIQSGTVVTITDLFLPDLGMIDLGQNIKVEICPIYYRFDAVNPSQFVEDEVHVEKVEEIMNIDSTKVKPTYDEVIAEMDSEIEILRAYTGMYYSCPEVLQPDFVNSMNEYYNLKETNFSDLRKILELKMNEVKLAKTKLSVFHDSLEKLSKLKKSNGFNFKF